MSFTVTGTKRRQDEYASQLSTDGRGTKSSKQSCASSFINQYSYVLSSLDPECSTKQYRVEYFKNRIRFKTRQKNQSSLKTLAQDHQNGMLKPYQWIDLNGTGTESGAISFAPLQTTGSDAAKLLLANANKKYTDLLQKNEKEAGGDYPGPLLQSDYVVDGFRVFVFYMRPVKENRQRELALLQNAETGTDLTHAVDPPEFTLDTSSQQEWRFGINRIAKEKQDELRKRIEDEQAKVRKQIEDAEERDRDLHSVLETHNELLETFQSMQNEVDTLRNTHNNTTPQIPLQQPTFRSDVGNNQTSLDGEDAQTPLYGEAVQTPSNEEQVQTGELSVYGQNFPDSTAPPSEQKSNLSIQKNDSQWALTFDETPFYWSIYP